MMGLLGKDKWRKPRRLTARLCGGMSPAPQISRSPTVFRLHALFVASALIFTFGCNDSVQPTPDWQDTAYVGQGELVPEATRIVWAGLDDPNPLIRVHAIEVVATTNQIRMMPKVQQMLRDRFSSVRFAASLAVGDLQYSIAEREVAAVLSDRDPNVRIAAAYALGKLGRADSFEMLREAIAGSDQTLRANAALLLGKSGDKRALALLYIALRLRDSDDKVVYQAVESIARLGDERIMPKLWTMLISAYADVRVMGVKATGALGTPKARDALLTMLDDKVLEVRLAAAEQLGSLGSSAGENVVLDVFRKKLTVGLDRVSLERISVFTALAIGRIGTERLTKFLPRLLRSDSKSVRLAAAMAVFQSKMEDRSVGKSPVAL